MTAVRGRSEAVAGWLAPAPRFRLAVAGLAVLAAVLAGVGHLWLFDQGSLNADEVAYVLQAEAIADGELFLEVRQPAEAHQPWFFVERDEGFVSKYLPLTSALLAVGLVASGSIVPSLVALAALVPVVVAALAREVGLSRPLSFGAAAVTTLSPVVVVESALPLSYVPFLVVVSTAWLLVVRLGRHRSGWGGAALLGLASTAAASLRPYDAVLLIGPAVVWAALQRRSDVVRLGTAAALGALPLGVAIALYNAVATGAPWRLPFALLEPSDGIGFGRRRLAPEYELVSFGPVRGLTGLVVHFGMGLALWWALGLALLPAAGLAWRRTSAVGRMLLVLVAVHLAGYLAFWGPWNISVHWGGANRVLGPVYAMPVGVLVALVGLPVLAAGWRSRPRLVRPLVGVAVVVGLAQLGYGVWQASLDAERTREVLAVADRARADAPLLLGVDPPYLGNPVTGLVEDVALAAAWPVPAAGTTMPRLLQLPRAVYGSSTLSYVVTGQERVEGPEVDLEVRLVDRRADVLVVERNGRASACALRDAVAVTVTADGHRGCEGVDVPSRWARDTTRHCPDRACLVVATYHVRSGELRRQGWRRLPVDTDDGGVALLVDGEVVESGGGGWLRVSPPPAGQEQPAGVPSSAAAR